MGLEKHAIADRIWFDEPEGRFPEAIFENEHGRGRISLYGAHLLSLSLKAGGDVFWLSPDAVYREGKAIRGGVPPVFPWFGSHPKENSHPAHGFARISHWNVVATQATEHELSLSLSLTPTAATQALWPHKFTLCLTTTLNSHGVQQSLKLSNTGDTAWTWAGGFHPYFAVGNLGSTRLRETEGLTYVDLRNGEILKQTGDLSFGPEIDRAYTTAPQQLILSDMTHHREIVIEPTGADSTVVWNPGLDKPKSDMPKNGPDKFVCVEPARSAHIKSWEERSNLAPGESTEIAYRVHIRHV